MVSREGSGPITADGAWRLQQRPGRGNAVRSPAVASWLSSRGGVAHGSPSDRGGDREAEDAGTTGLSSSNMESCSQRGPSGGTVALTAPSKQCTLFLSPSARHPLSDLIAPSSLTLWPKP